MLFYQFEARISDLAPVSDSRCQRSSDMIVDASTITRVVIVDASTITRYSDNILRLSEFRNFIADSIG